MKIQEFFIENPEIAVACSGGVDSVFLLYLAQKYAKKVKAYFVKSVFQPMFELEDAKELCEQIGVELKIIKADVLSQDAVITNPPNRCYYCKKEIFGRIMKAAAEDGMTVLLDGTNASDDASDRPGMKALRELNVLSPLRMCGYTKTMIREGAKEAGLFVHKKPSYACLATRIPTNQKITGELLTKIEAAEGVLFDLGFRDFRVRIYYNMAKIQISEAQLEKLIEERQPIREKLSDWFEEVALDLKTR